MKRLLTLSAILLFSVDVFAEEYCYAAGANIIGLDDQINEKCYEDNVLYAVLSRPADDGIHLMNQLSIWYCDFEQEIIINSDDINTYLQCVKFDDKGRRPTPKSFPLD